MSDMIRKQSASVSRDEPLAKQRTTQTLDNWTDVTGLNINQLMKDLWNNRLRVSLGSIVEIVFCVGACLVLINCLCKIWFRCSLFWKLMWTINDGTRPNVSRPFLCFWCLWTNSLWLNWTERTMLATSPLAHLWEFMKIIIGAIVKFYRPLEKN